MSVPWRFTHHVEIIRTATGPGGRSGPLRVDLQGQFRPAPLQGEHGRRGAVRVQPDAYPPPGERRGEYERHAGIRATYNQFPRSPYPPRRQCAS